MGGKRPAVELHGVDTHVDQHFNPAVTEQADGVFGLEQRGHHAGKRGNHFVIGGNNRGAAAQQAAGKRGIRHLVESKNGTGHRR